MPHVDFVLSPEGHLYLDHSEHAKESLPEPTLNKIMEWFTYSPAKGLLHLGIADFRDLPPGVAFWQGIARYFIEEVCKSGNLSDLKELGLAERNQIIAEAPFIRGFEYLSIQVLAKIWQDLQQTFTHELQENGTSLQDYLSLYNSRWNLVGRICFHLAENKNNLERPFAFLATYTTKLGAVSAHHVPLKRALQEYAGEKNQAALLALLLPVQKAAEKSQFIRQLLDSGHVFHAVTWNAREAYQFLTSIAIIEEAGVMVKVPNWWNPQKPLRPNVDVRIDRKGDSLMGLDTLLDFDIALSLSNGERLTEEEWQELMATEGNLVKVKGQWVEIDHEKLQNVLTHWQKIRALSAEGISFVEGMRLLAGSGQQMKSESETERIVEWSNVHAGECLKTILNKLRDPKKIEKQNIEPLLEQYLHATLRPYQMAGVNWLWFLYQLKLGACLADDMGLGKTIQVLAFLLLVKHRSSAHKKTSLLIVPASLIGNWQAEIAKFASSLNYLILHGSADREVLKDETREQVKKFDLIITTYSFAYRLEWLKDVKWDAIILDEAQTIKNPSAKQTKAIKALNSKIRFTLTGTPVENRIEDLWSLFDFTSPGLLGSMSSFCSYAKNAGPHFMSIVRQLTAPYILRRLKTDRSIIADLPDKTEMPAYCTLSKHQATLYEQSVRELKKELEQVDKTKRRGLVLSFLLRFKQICNHPTQWLGYGEYEEAASGKLLRLRQICEEIATKQEKVLVFTQFTEIIPALSATLTKVFCRGGLTLDGSTAVKKRAELVASFQEEQGPPFFVLSLKAGGTGLTLTRASHVIHFDRWWNPAVENQATDRAYRIGQKHPVIVHKFICRGTVEEKIDMMITAKKNLSAEVLQNGNEFSFTELNNDELIDMISLDIHKALEEE